MNLALIFYRKKTGAKNHRYIVLWRFWRAFYGHVWTYFVYRRPQQTGELTNCWHHRPRAGSDGTRTRTVIIFFGRRGRAKNCRHSLWIGWLDRLHCDVFGGSGGRCTWSRKALMYIGTKRKTAPVCLVSSFTLFMYDSNLSPYPTRGQENDRDHSEH